MLIDWVPLGLEPGCCSARPANQPTALAPFAFLNPQNPNSTRTQILVRQNVRTPNKDHWLWESRETADVRVCVLHVGILAPPPRPGSGQLEAYAHIYGIYIQDHMRASKEQTVAHPDPGHMGLSMEQ